VTGCSYRKYLNKILIFAIGVVFQRYLSLFRTWHSFIPNFFHSAQLSMHFSCSCFSLIPNTRLKVWKLFSHANRTRYDSRNGNECFTLSHTFTSFESK
jgi:hypothetical protein